MHLCAFIAILVPKLVPVVPPLCPLYTGVTDKFPDSTNPMSKPFLQSEMSSLDWSTTKTPVICNHILVISYRNAFIYISSNFSPNIGCYCKAPLSLVYGSVTNEFPDNANPISKPSSVWICCIQLKLWPFL